MGKILESESNSSRVLLVEFGQIGDMVTRQTGVVLKLLELVGIAMRHNWFVVVSLSGGATWKQQSTVASSIITAVTDGIMALMREFDLMRTSSFTKREALKFMELNNINNQWESDLDLITGWNPYLLSCFKTEWNLSIEWYG